MRVTEAEAKPAMAEDAEPVTTAKAKPTTEVERKTSMAKHTIEVESVATIAEVNPTMAEKGNLVRVVEAKPVRTEGAEPAMTAVAKLSMATKRNSPEQVGNMVTLKVGQLNKPRGF